jgi:molybdopterin converting factor small subunit
MQISVRLSSGLARYSGSPLLKMSLDEGATVADLLAHLRLQQPAMAGQLDSVVAVISGTHVPHSEPLSPGQEVALLIPISGGCL